MYTLSARLFALCGLFCTVLWVQLGLAQRFVPSRRLVGRDAQQDLDHPASRGLGRRSLARTDKKGAKVEFIITSDSHGAFGKGWKFYDSFMKTKADVMIHCGDVSDLGKIQEYKDVVKSLKDHPAKTKIFIGGNHDFTLDEEYMKRKDVQAGDVLPTELKGNAAKIQKEIKDAQAVFQTKEAKDAGIVFLNKGWHTIWADTQGGRRVRLKVRSQRPYLENFTPLRWDSPCGRSTRTRTRPSSTVTRIPYRSTRVARRRIPNTRTSSQTSKHTRSSSPPL